MTISLPNEKTRAALAEYDEMEINPSKYRRYNSFDDMMSELDADA